MTTIPFYTPLPEFQDDDVLSATRLNQMLTNIDAVYGLDQRMSVPFTYGWTNAIAGTQEWKGWVAYHGNQLVICLQEAGTVEFDQPAPYTKTFHLSQSFGSGGVKTINLEGHGYVDYQVYQVRVDGSLPPLYAYMTDRYASLLDIGAMPSFVHDTTSSPAHFNAIVNPSDEPGGGATAKLAKQFCQPVVGSQKWSNAVALNNSNGHSIVFYMQHRHARLEFYVTATSSDGNSQAQLDSLAFSVWDNDVSPGSTEGRLIWAQSVPRPGKFPPDPNTVFNVPLDTSHLTVGNWYKFRFTHNQGSGGQENGRCDLYYYGQQRTATAGLWMPQSRWELGDVVDGNSGQHPQLVDMSDNLTWLNGRRHSTNPVMPQSTQTDTAAPARFFSKRIHRWLAYENYNEELTPALFYTTDRLNVFANVTMPVSYTTVYLDLDTTPIKTGMVFYADNCHYAIQVPDPL
jgi:hypothetical protein